MSEICKMELFCRSLIYKLIQKFVSDKNVFFELFSFITLNTIPKPRAIHYSIM